MKKLLLLIPILLLASCSSPSSSSNQESSSQTVTNLEKVSNIIYDNGILSYDEVENAEGYNIKFTHNGVIQYEDQIIDTAIDIMSLGLKGTIDFSVSAYNGQTVSEESQYRFLVLSKIEDVIFEAEENLYNFGTGKEQSNFRNNPSAHKGAYVGGIDDAGQGIYINYLCPKSGTYQFDAYYTTDMEPSHNDVWVNGEYQARYDFLEKTGWGGSTFNPAKASVSITLKEGWNTISVMKNGDASDNYGSFTELDYFVLKGNGEEYNFDDLDQYGTRPEHYRLEAEMGSPRKKDSSSMVTCKNPCIVQGGEFKYSNGFLMGGVEKNYDGVSWHFNSPVKAKYKLRIAYASGEFSGSKLASPSFVVTPEEIGLAKSADFKKYDIVTMNPLPYTGWNRVNVSSEEVEITLEQGKNFIHCLLLDSVESGFFQIDYVDMTFIEEVI